MASKCLYCGEKITITDPQGAVHVKIVDDEGKRWGALPLGERA